MASRTPWDRIPVRSHFWGVATRGLPNNCVSAKVAHVSTRSVCRGAPCPTYSWPQMDLDFADWWGEGLGCGLTKKSGADRTLKKLTAGITATVLSCSDQGWSRT